MLIYYSYLHYLGTTNFRDPVRVLEVGNLFVYDTVIFVADLDLEVTGSITGVSRYQKTPKIVLLVRPIFVERNNENIKNVPHADSPH